MTTLLSFTRITLASLLAVLLLAGCGGSAIPATALASPPAMPTNPPVPALGNLVLFDDDGSRDGTAALLYLLSLQEVSIQAISVSYGEAHPETYVQHIGSMLDQLGITGIPLGAGQDAPLAGGIPFPDWLRGLSDAFWEVPLTNPRSDHPYQDASQLMVSVIHQASEPVKIFVSGPFTNLAQALQLDPGIRDNIAAVFFMGGAVYVPGNITNLVPDSNNLVAEWNILADPQAAKVVFESGLDLYMVPLDATGRVILRQGDVLPWNQGDARANIVAALYDVVFNQYGIETVEIFDLTAAVLLARPELCPFEPLYLEVVSQAGSTLGQTAVVPDGEPNVRACLDPDANRIKQALEDIFASSP